MRRREFIALLGSSAMWPLASYAQQPKPAPLKRIGILDIFGCRIPPDLLATRRLAELGWFEGRNFVVDCVTTIRRLDQLPTLAHELVSRHPDVLISVPIPFIKALKQETTAIPIVMTGTPEPVRTGIITNLARPVGNVTGVSLFGFDIISKRIELLKEIVPTLKRLAIILSVYDDPKAAEIVDEDLAIAATKLGFTWEYFRGAVANDYDKIFARLAAEHFDAAYITPSPLINQNRPHVIQLALRHLIPTIGEGPVWAKDGLLLSYGPNFIPYLARAAEYVDKILRGAKPGDLPVEQATRLQLVINLKTSKTLGITVQPSLIARADEVIE